MQQLVSIRCIGTFPGIVCVNIMFNAACVVKMARFSAVLQRVLLQIPKVNTVGLDWLSLCVLNIPLQRTYRIIGKSYNST